MKQLESFYSLRMGRYGEKVWQFAIYVIKNIKIEDVFSENHTTEDLFTWLYLFQKTFTKWRLSTPEAIALIRQ